MGDGEQNISIFLVFFVTLLATVLILSKYLHDRPILSSILPEAAMVLLVGMVAGFVIHLVIFNRMSQLDPNSYNNNAGDDDAFEEGDDDNVDMEDVDDDLYALLSFSPEIFFVALLPPIIFNSGLRVGALFFRHFAPIVLFAMVGTTISAISIAFFLFFIFQTGLCTTFNPTLTELLTFGALISSTDPVSTLAAFQARRVDPQLFYLVFGESVLNDGLAIVLFESLSKFVSRDNDASTVVIGFLHFLLDLALNSIGSLCLGCSGGLVAALMFKQIDMTQNRLLEISVYLLLMYIPFLLAEILHLSGIVTILFTGIASNRYVVPNLTSITRVNADMVCRLLAHLAETSIFLELGLSVYGLKGHWNWSFIGWSLLACLIGRSLNIYPIVFFFNQFLLRPQEGDDDVEEEDQGMEGFIANACAASSSGGSSSSPTSPKLRQLELTECFHPSTVAEQDRQLVRQAMSFETTLSDMTPTPVKRKDLKIRRKTSHMLWFSGLRGAVAYACARTFPDTFGHQKDFVMTTMAIVLITVFLLGGTTELALSLLRIPVGVDEEKFMKERLREPVVSSFVTDFDRDYICPLVIRDFKVTNHLTDAEKQNACMSPTMRHRTFTESIEVTDVEHMDTVSDTGTDDPFLKIARQDSLFDYGAT